MCAAAAAHRLVQESCNRDRHKRGITVLVGAVSIRWKRLRSVVCSDHHPAANRFESEQTVTD